MENGVLVDSSVYIHLLRKGVDPVAALQAEYGSIDIVTCGIIKVEVLRGIRNLKARTQMETFFSLCLNVPSHNSIWDSTVELAWALERSGQVIPATDILIAVSALHVGASVLTLDQHFSVVPRLSMAKVPESWL